MQIHKFEGSSVHEALGQAQKALGPEALILETRRLPGARSFTSARVEVLAAVAEYPRARPVQENRLRSELTVRPISIVPGRCATAAFIGPTGCGKTTAVAKLAVSASQEEEMKIGVLSIAGSSGEGLQSLMSLSLANGITCSTATSASEAERARAMCRHFGLLLIDTAGISTVNSSALAHQAEILTAAEPDEVHLCLPATLSASALRKAWLAFQPFRPTQLLITKLDEADDTDSLTSFAMECGLPFSYVSSGQRIPEDIAPASVDDLACRIGGRA